MRRFWNISIKRFPSHWLPWHIFICDWCFVKPGIASTKFRIAGSRLPAYHGEERVMLVTVWLV